MAGPLDRSKVRSYSIRERSSKVGLEQFARPIDGGASFAQWVGSLPDILAAQDLKKIVQAMVEARRRGSPNLIGMGAHVIKVGLNPLLIQWLREGWIQGIALNGAGMIHDFELALVGRTSEDVAAEVGSGTFGMARETAEELNAAARDARQRGIGLGRAAGERILAQQMPHADSSLLAVAAELNRPVTIHVALGTDIIHMHPSADGADIGAASYQDFLIFAGLVADLAGGVYLNIGSAVLLPEVFLKALTLARNLEHPVRNFTTANFDFIRHYRPDQNVVRRPVQDGGAGYHLVGHHELMIPLLAGLLALESPGDG